MIRKENSAWLMALLVRYFFSAWRQFTRGRWPHQRWPSHFFLMRPFSGIDGAARCASTRIPLEGAMEIHAFSARSRSPTLRWRSAALALLAFSFAGALAAQPQKVNEESLRVQGPIAGMRLGLRHAFATAQPGTHRPVVVMLHGAGVPV